MKNLPFALLLSLLGGAAHAQRHVALKLNAMSVGSASVEYGFAPRQSITVGGAYDLLFKGLPPDFDFTLSWGGPTVKFSAKGANFSIPVEYRYYFARARRPLRGWFVAPYAKYKQMNYLEVTHYDGSGGGWLFGGGGPSWTSRRQHRQESMAFGSGLGYQAVIADYLVLNCSGGVGYKVYRTHTYVQDGQMFRSGADNPFSTRFDLGIGVRLGPPTPKPN